MAVSVVNICICLVFIRLKRIFTIKEIFVDVKFLAELFATQKSKDLRRNGQDVGFCFLFFWDKTFFKIRKLRSGFQPRIWSWCEPKSSTFPGAHFREHLHSLSKKFFLLLFCFIFLQSSQTSRWPWLLCCKNVRMNFTAWRQEVLCHRFLDCLVRELILDTLRRTDAFLMLNAPWPTGKSLYPSS